MDKIIDAGVKVFKIEGKARSAEYVKKMQKCYCWQPTLSVRGATPELAAFEG